MRMLKAIIVFATFCYCGIACASTIIKAVSAQQSGRAVEIAVTMTGPEDEVSNVQLVLAATNTATKAELSTASVERIGNDEQNGLEWTRRYIWDAATDLGNIAIDDIELTVSCKNILVGIQLWEDGPYFAECNVGASKPEEYGYYFWWGDTVGYKRNAVNNGWVSVKDGSSFSFSYGNCPTYGKSNSDLQSLGYIDSTGNLTAAHDAATTHLGAPWRMPTDAEFAALLNNCDTTWTTRNGIYGRIIRGRGAYSSKSIFLPAVGFGGGSGLFSLGSYGYYWRSTPHSRIFDLAWGLSFSSNYVSLDFQNRHYGQSVRPVRGSVEAGSVDVNGVTVHFPWSGGAAEPVDGSVFTWTDSEGYTWTYQMNSDGVIIGSGIRDQLAVSPETDGLLPIPSSINGKPVVSIADCAFEDSRFSSVSIPDSVKCIGKLSFSGMKNLTAVKLPSSLLTIRRKAFDGNTALTSVTMSPNVTLIDSHAFDECAFAKLALPNSIESIGEDAFIDCANFTTLVVSKSQADRIVGLLRSSGFTGITTVEYSDEGPLIDENGVLYGYEGEVPSELIIPDTVTEIAAGGMFEECDIDVVTIPASVVKIGAEAFAGESKGYPDSIEAWGVKHFKVEEGNPRYRAENGMLYDYVDKIVVAAEVGISGIVTLPDDCRVVGDKAFKAKHLITGVVAPVSLTRLEYKAFSECSSLTNLDFSATSLAYAGEKCFRDSWNLKTVRFPSTLVAIGNKAFESEASTFGFHTALKAVYFTGAIPSVDGYLYWSDAEVTTYVKRNDAWEKVVSEGVWQNHPILYIEAEAETIEIVVDDVNGTIALPEGATEESVSIKIMVGGHNIRPYINLPVAVGGVIDLSAAVVKPEVAAEAMDITKGAEITLSATNPTITTAPTKPGLTYTLVEGATIESMGAGASKLGDGTAWTPEIKVKGGVSAFYSIKVTK